MSLRILVLSALAAISALTITGISIAQDAAVTRIEDYNQILPHWGVSWTPGANAANGYYPTFYTGFIMRSEFPERIHVHVGRGNQTRVSIILDETTVSDYAFDLVKRYSFYQRAAAKKAVDINPKGAKFLPQLSYFNQIIESNEYGILPFVQSAQQGGQSEEEIYAKGLELLSTLNPGRVFLLKIDLVTEFNRWKADMQEKSNGSADKILGDAKLTVTAINTLVFGRVNYIAKPTPEVTEALRKALDLALTPSSTDADFIPAALALFKTTTGSKYQIKVLNAQNQFESAIQCDSNSCFLNYPEFTSIYPTGSVEASTTDEFGNRINLFATPGLWQFLAYGGKSVDNIRNEPYYGWAPKMDYEGIGNGFHNPAVRFWNPSNSLKQSLGLSKDHTTLWAVKRGGVSHGCLRLPLGHVWEMRQSFPVENEKMIQIPFFGNNSQDFDVYDIDGDGQLEVMGVEYKISYGLQGADGLARREGSGFEVNEGATQAFYEKLYGARKVFETEGDKYIFLNPKISIHSHLDFKRKSVSTRLALPGRYPLYEQVYQKDKVQFYAPAGGVGNKQLIRLMGRIKGCAPSSDKTVCGEKAFDTEAAGIVK